MNLSTLIKIIERLKPTCEFAITEDTLLRDLGLSSLDMMVLICELEQIWDTKVQLDMLQTTKTVKQFYATIIKQ